MEVHKKEKREFCLIKKRSGHDTWINTKNGLYVDTEVAVHQPIIQYSHPDIQYVFLVEDNQPGAVIRVHVL